MNDYTIKFVESVFARLGGLEMANEFFAKHPRCVALTRDYAASYYQIVADAAFAAEVFFNRLLKPIIAADRRSAQKAWAEGLLE